MEPGLSAAAPQAVADAKGISQASVIEMAIREMAKKEGLR